MKQTDWHSMSIDELWALREKLAEVLVARIAEEKSTLEERLRQLTPRFQPGRRPYPRVLPKYRNPDWSSQTWSGRGKQPRWLTAHLHSGKRVEDFLIAQQQRGE